MYTYIWVDVNMYMCIYMCMYIYNAHICSFLEMSNSALQDYKLEAALWLECNRHTPQKGSKVRMNLLKPLLLVDPKDMDPIQEPYAQPKAGPTTNSDCSSGGLIF